MTPESSNNLDLVKSQLGLGPLANLKANAKDLAQVGKVKGGKDATGGKEADAKRWKASLDFEAMFLGQMYKSMRQTAISSDLTEASPGREIFTDMLDQQYASLHSKSPLDAGPIGMKNAMKGASNTLASQIYRALRTQETGSASSDASDVSADGGDDAMFSTMPVLAKVIAKYSQ